MAPRHGGPASALEKRPAIPRRAFLGVLAASGVGGVALAARRSLLARLPRWTRSPAFVGTPPLVPHDPRTERRTLHVARGGGPAANVDEVLRKLGGIGRGGGADDVVLLKVSAQWWNQGMTNVAAVARVIEHVLEREGFAGEVVVVENTHFRRADGSGLSRAFTHPSDRNVDVPGWTTMGDLARYWAERRAPVGFVGLVDAAPSALAGDDWHDPDHAHGVYGGDGRGPLEEGEARDGYRWDFARAFRLRRSLVEEVRTPLSWPVFTSPTSGLVIDLAGGVFRRDGGRLVPAGRKLTLVSMPTVNEHASTGITCCCKSAMGLVDMSAGRMGTHPAARDYRSVHHFGEPDATWRMAGPLAHFAREVRAPDLYLAVAKWVAATPAGFPPDREIRVEAASAHRAGTVVAGTDPVAIDWWCAKNLVAPVSSRRELVDPAHPDSKVVRFLRYYRQVYGAGTMDDALIDVV